MSVTRIVTILTLVVTIPACGGDSQPGEADAEAVDQSGQAILNADAVSVAEEERLGFAKLNHPELETCVPNSDTNPCASGSASLLNSRYVISATHVIETRLWSPTTYTVRMGNQERRVSRAFTHGDRDVQVLQVHPPFDWSGERPLIGRHIAVGELVREVGSSPHHHTLRRDRPNHTAVFTVSHSSSAEFRWHSNVVPVPTTEINESTLVGHDRQMTWWGDSGGPMLIQQNGDWILAGIEFGCYTRYLNHPEDCAASQIEPLRSWIEGIRNDHTHIYFPHPWSSPYPDNLVADAPFDPGCPGAYQLTFDYDFECGADIGHFLRLDTWQVEELTCSGARSIQTTEPVHFALFTDGSVQRAGFSNVMATCL